MKPWSLAFTVPCHQFPSSHTDLGTSPPRFHACLETLFPRFLVALLRSIPGHPTRLAARYLNALSPRRLEFPATCAPPALPIAAGLPSARRPASERNGGLLGKLADSIHLQPWSPGTDRDRETLAPRPHRPKVKPAATSHVRLATLVPWCPFALPSGFPAARPPCRLAAYIDD